MIYLIQGSDTFKTRDKYDSLIASLLARKLDSFAWKIDGENWNEETFKELIVSQDLFAKKYIVGCDHLLADKKSREIVLERLSEMKESANIFIILESELEAEASKIVHKYAEKDLSFDKKLGEKKSFNIFALTDALGERNRKRLWVLYQEALRADLSAEEVFWKFQWLVKHLLFFKVAKNPATSELKEGFAKKKILGFGKNYTKEELEKMSSELVDLFHRVRGGEGEMETELEKWVFGV